MALVVQAAGVGVDFDGTVGQGEFLLGTSVDDDMRRVLIHSVALSASGNVDTVSARLAPTLADANGDLFIEILVLATAAPGVSKSGCAIIPPAGWNLYFFSTDGGVPTKNAILDFRRITLTTRK